MDDLPILVETRMEVLREVYAVAPEANMTELERESADYYAKSLADGNHIGYFVFLDGVFVGTGGVSFYRVMPTCDNPTGEKAYIMNMYIRKEHRRKGIASEVMEMLLNDIRKRGITHIGLEASEMGKEMYRKFGFAPSDDELHKIITL